MQTTVFITGNKGGGEESTQQNYQEFLFGRCAENSLILDVLVYKDHMT